MSNRSFFPAHRMKYVYCFFMIEEINTHFESISAMSELSNHCDDAAMADLEAETLEASNERDLLTQRASNTSRSPSPPPAVPVHPPVPPQRTSRTRRNYSRTELMHAFSIIERIIPCDSDEWAQVAEEHSRMFEGRDVDSIKRKFCDMHRRKAPTGDPSIPPEVLLAKKCKVLIGDKAMIGGANEVFDMEGEGTFTGPDGSVRPHNAIASITTREDTESSTVGSISTARTTGIGGGSLSSRRSSSNDGGGRGGRRPDVMNLIMLQMKEDRDIRMEDKRSRDVDRNEREKERTAERDERAADRRMLMEMVSTAVGGLGKIFSSNKKRKRKSGKSRKSRKVKSKRRKSIGRVIEESSSSSSSSDSGSRGTDSSVNTSHSDRSD